MRAKIDWTPKGQRGFSLIGMLLVVIILLVLSSYYFKGGDENPGVTGYYNKTTEAASTYQTVIGRAQNVAQGENVRNVQGMIDQWAMSHPNEQCTVEKLQAAGFGLPAPPAGFRWEINENNQAQLASAEPAPPGFGSGGAAPPLPNVGK